MIVALSVAERWSATGDRRAPSPWRFDRVPVAEEATVPVAVKVALLVVGRLTVVEMLPVPRPICSCHPRTSRSRSHR